jgi:galactose-1-phosphate uridylyltransferase
VIPVSDYVNYGTKIGKSDYGIQLYHLPDNREQLSKYHLHAKIYPGKKKTYLDYELKLKEHVPNKFYDVA